VEKRWIIAPVEESPIPGIDWREICDQPCIAELLKRSQPKESKPAPVSFDAALKRCHTVTEMLEALPEPLDVQQRMDLGDAVAGLRKAAAGLGVAVFDRR